MNSEKKSATDCHSDPPWATYEIGETPSEGTEMTHKPAARCRATDVDPDLFFANDAQAIAEAKKICQNCPLRDQCLEESLDPQTGSAYGTFGGLSEAERTPLLHGRTPRSHAA